MQQTLSPHERSSDRAPNPIVVAVGRSFGLGGVPLQAFPQRPCLIAGGGSSTTMARSPESALTGVHVRRGSVRGALACCLAICAAWPTTILLGAPGAQMGLRSGDTSQDVVVVNSGAQWISLSSSWATLEPRAGIYNEVAWAALIDRLSAVHAQGLKVLLILTGAPDWATNGRDPARAPRAPAPRMDAIPQYAQLLSDLGRRAGPYVDGWSIWNEPNLELFFDPPSPGALIVLQRAGYAALKAGDPSSTILAGPFATVGQPSSWLADLYRRGLKGSADAVALNFYPMFPPEYTDYDSAGRLNPTSLVAGLRQAKAVIDRRDRSRPIWVTEMSWSTCDSGPPVCVDEQRQADYLRRAYRILWRHTPWVKVAFWYTAQDTAPGTAWSHAQGLRRADGAPKPSWSTFTDLTHHRGATDPLPDGTTSRPRSPDGTTTIGPVAITKAPNGRLCIRLRVTTPSSPSARRVVISGTEGPLWTRIASGTSNGASVLTTYVLDRGYTALRITAGTSRAPAQASRVVRVRPTLR